MSSSSGTHQAGDLVNIVFNLPENIAPEPILISVTQPLSINLNEVHASAANSNTSFEYSGRHDQGVLPQLKTEGHLANVIAAILDAKQQSDNILTKLIEEHQAVTTTNGKSVVGKSKASVDIGDLEEEGDEEITANSNNNTKKKTKKTRTDPNNGS